MAEIRWVTAFVDLPAAAFDVGARFWAAVTGWPLSERRGEQGQFATLLPPAGDAFLRVQAVGSGGGLHLDLHTDDVAGLATRAEDLGADVTDRSAQLVLLRSPGGFRFCVTEHGGETRHPAATVWPGGRSLPDQVCLDLPAHLADPETAFWAGLTGWALTPSDSPEFQHLRDPSLPVRLLLQRLGAGDPGQVVRAHLDLSCDDVDAEAVRHVGLGATLLDRRPGWTVLRDPAGLVYCATARVPPGP
ncbi:MAG TPA: VOC family protein [Dermatophilaceae bacterium]|nr:VOC family protein [Dermatophilaceae bacterium]